MPRPEELVRIEHLIRELRGEKVILDSDLARLYGVSTKRLNEQVKRNRERFRGFYVSAYLRGKRCLEVAKSPFSPGRLGPFYVAHPIRSIHNSADVTL